MSHKISAGREKGARTGCAAARPAQCEHRRRLQRAVTTTLLLLQAMMLLLLLPVMMLQLLLPSAHYHPACWHAQTWP
jgi:hypothetical protein